MPQPYTFTPPRNRASVSKQSSGSVILFFSHYTGVQTTRVFDSAAEYTAWARRGGGWPEL